MKKFFLVMAMLFFTSFLSVSAHAGLDDFLLGLNYQAKADRNLFTVRLNTQFGIPLPQVHSILDRVKDPADAFMCLQLSSMSHKPLDHVLRTYETSGKKGWGVMAKELGIKPGSAEFHALKKGAFSFTGLPDGTAKGKGQKKVKNKQKGKGKGHHK